MNESIKRLHKRWELSCNLADILFGKQQFSIFRQRPYFVIHFHLQVVDVVADLVKIWAYFFFVCECPFFVVFHVVGYFSRFGHVAHEYFDRSDPV